MKAGAFILAIILAVLMAQPILISLGAVAVNSSITKSQTPESACCKSKCSKPRPEENKKDCEGNRCNPLMGCPTGNFYIHNYSTIAVSLLIVPRQRAVLFNDNRISKQATECWHPPEII
jgi:hypothetical protein